MAIATDHAGIWKEYKNGVAYQQSMSFTKDWPKYERFKEHKQWPHATKQNEDLPRPVFNFIRQMVQSKKSNVLSQIVKMLFSPEELPDDTAMLEKFQAAARDFTDMAVATWEDIDQDALNDEAVDNAATTGPGIWHYYWDQQAHGGTVTKYVGKLAGEVIDAINFFVADPQQRNVQKQPYIIITGRTVTDDLREEAKNNGGDFQAVQADKNTSYEAYDSAQHETDGVDKTTWALKYYRQNGSVYWTKVTEDAAIIPPRPLHKTFNMTLYPVEVMSWELRKKCIYGMGEVEGLIANQKIYNFLIAMLTKSVQDNAWPKFWTMPGALQQNVTSAPGEVLTDYKGNAASHGFGYMTPPSFSQMPVELGNTILNTTRNLAGVSDVITGNSENLNNLAAAAIISLQNQARLPIQNIQSRFYASVKNIGQIWEEFFKAYYNLPRPLTTSDPKTGQKVTRTFVGAKYADISFGLKIDVGPGSSYSEALIMTTLDKLLQMKAITVAQYAKYAPSTVIPSGLKEELDQQAQPSGIPGETPVSVESIMQGLSPQEQAALKGNPQLLNEVSQMIADAVTQQKGPAQPEQVQQQ